MDWLNGRDLTFSNMGTSPHTIGNCHIEYIKVLEDKHEHIFENGVCKCGMVQTSTFEILDTRCNQIEIFAYETGMTWSEWLNSKYNTGIGSCIAIWVSEEHNILGCNPNMDIYVNGDRADYDSKISEKDIIELVKY